MSARREHSARPRGSGDPLALVNVIKHEVQTLDPDQPVASISTMEGNIASSLAARRLIMTLLGAFAGLALVLASVGLYGVMALSVTQRTRELGIRMALGAARYDVFRLVLSHGALLVCIGIVLGLIGAIAASHALQAVLVQCWRARSARLRDRNWCSRFHRTFRLLPAGAPRQPGRPHDRSARRLIAENKAISFAVLKDGEVPPMFFFRRVLKLNPSLF